MRREVRYGVIGGALALVAGSVGGYALFSDPAPAQARQEVRAEGEPGDVAPTVKTGPLTAEEVKTTAEGFLGAWQQGDADKAARLTDSAEDATAALTAFREQAHISKMTIKPVESGTPRAGGGKNEKVPYTVTAEVDYKGQRATLAYDSELTVERGEKGEPVVGWRPSLLHPRLGPGDSLRTGESEAPPIKAVDRDGVELSKESYPALAGVLGSLRDKYGAKAGGKAGVEIFIHRAKSEKSSEQRPDETLKLLSEGTAGTLRTTLDAKVQAAAERAVKGKSKASAVAVRPSTGEILAIANSPAEGFNAAVQGSMAPGSTMKIVTAAMLMDKGLAAPGKAHPCPKYVTYSGWKFQNLDKFEIENGTFDQSFARSCNTAFISQAEKLKDDDLTKEAREVFGIGQNWQTGIPTFDGAVPVQSDAQMAASLIGQGGVRMNPLTMASVAATVQSGAFHQPYVIAPSLDGRSLATAGRAMKPATAQGIKSLMRLTATAGTGAQAMAGVSGDIGAKTGSAEVDGQEKPNAWFTAFRGDIAAAAVVPASGHGGSNAGPVVRAILTAR